jgi:hypothetical protein
VLVPPSRRLGGRESFVDKHKIFLLRQTSPPEHTLLQLARCHQEDTGIRFAVINEATVGDWDARGARCLCRRDGSWSLLLNSETTGLVLGSDEPILRRILDYLLLAKEVKHFPNASDSHQCKFVYHFQTAILRSCRFLHALGLQVLASNHFILVSCSDGKWFSDVLVPNIGLWARASSKLKYIRAHLFFGPDVHKSKTIANKVSSALICLDALLDLVWALRRAQLAGRKHKYVLQFKPLIADRELPVRTQRHILQQLEPLHGSNQQFAVRGSVNSLLARAVESVITSPLLWFRGRNHHIYDFTKRKFELGNAASKAEAWKAAIRHYERSCLEHVAAGP